MAFDHLPFLADNADNIAEARIQSNASLDDMLSACGLNWNIRRAQYAFKDQNNEQHIGKNRVLFRDDSGAELSIMSKERYKVTQPRQIFETLYSLANAGDFEPINAGEMQGGRKIFMLAKHKQIENAELKAYLLLATSCDGSLSTTGKFLSFRPTCCNVLQFTSKAGDEIRIPHNRVYSPAEMAGELDAIGAQWGEFTEKVERFATAKIDDKQAIDYFARLYGPDKNLSLDKEPAPIADFSTRQQNTINQLMDNYYKGPGSQLATARGTVWGLVNAVTHYQDHQAPTRNGGRMHSATFGQGARMKDAAMYLADNLADKVLIAA